MNTIVAIGAPEPEPTPTYDELVAEYRARQTEVVTAMSSVLNQARSFPSTSMFNPF